MYRIQPNDKGAQKIYCEQAKNHQQECGGWVWSSSRGGTSSQSMIGQALQP